MRICSAVMARINSSPLWPSASQKIQNQLDDQKYALHRRRIKTATPVIDNTPPTSYEHLKTKLKKLQIDSERHAKIMQENLLLLKRMSDILHAKGPFAYQPPGRQQQTRFSSGNSKKLSSGKKSWREIEDPLSAETSWQKDWQARVDFISRLREEEKNKNKDGLCPRYIRDFGGDTDLLPRMVPPRRIAASSALPKQTRYNTSCKACQEGNKRANKSALEVIRPKAALPRRRPRPISPRIVQPVPDQYRADQKKDEGSTSFINLSEQFRKDFEKSFSSLQ